MAEMMLPCLLCDALTDDGGLCNSCYSPSPDTLLVFPPQSGNLPPTMPPNGEIGQFSWLPQNQSTDDDMLFSDPAPIPGLQEQQQPAQHNGVDNGVVMQQYGFSTALLATMAPRSRLGQYYQFGMEPEYTWALSTSPNAPGSRAQSQGASRADTENGERRRQGRSSQSPVKGSRVQKPSSSNMPDRKHTYQKEGTQVIAKQITQLLRSSGLNKGPNKIKLEGCANSFKKQGSLLEGKAKVLGVVLERQVLKLDKEAVEITEQQAPAATKAGLVVISNKPEKDNKGLVPGLKFTRWVLRTDENRAALDWFLACHS